MRCPGIAFSDNPTTAVYLDEQPITVGGFNPDPRLVDIERIEALSGPQGSLFGDASQCGTLRIITNKPDTSGFDGWVDLGVNTVNHGDTGYDVSAMVNIPLVEDALALRLVGFQNEEAGYIDNVLGTSPGRGQFPGETFDNAEFVEQDVNSITTSGARGMLRWQPTENWTIDGTAIFQTLEQDGFNDTDLSERFLEGRNVGEWQQIRYEDENFEDEWYQLGLTVEGDLGPVTLTAAGTFMNREDKFEADATTYLAGWQERYPNKFNDGAYPYYAIYDFPNQDPRAKVFSQGDTDRTSFEVRLATNNTDSRWSAIVGAFYNEVENQSHFVSNVQDLPDSGFDYYAYLCGAHCYLNYIAFYYNCGTGTYNTNLCVYPVTPSVNWWTGVYDSTLTQKALFGEVGFDLTDNFNITVGGRWFDIEVDRRLTQATLVGAHTNYRTLPPKPVCGTATNPVGDHCYQDSIASSSETGFVPKVTATWHIDDAKMVYATYSEGFRRGGANAARERSVFGRPPLNEFQSDLVTNYEIGAKTTWADGRVQFNITAYTMVWDDIQVEAEDPTPNLFTLGIVNFPEAEITGVELFWNWTPNDNLDLSISAGFNDAELSKDATLEVEGAPIDRTAVAGTPLPLTPDQKIAFSGSYYFDGMLFGGTPYFTLNIDHTGDSVNSLSGIQSIEFDTPTRQQDAYTLVGLRAGLDAERWSAAIYVNNATDEYAEYFYNDRWAQTRLSVNQPRTIGINYRLNFGN